MGLSARAVSAQRLLRRHTQLSRRWLEHLHDLRGDKALQERSSAAEAPRRTVINRRPQRPHTSKPTQKAGPARGAPKAAAIARLSAKRCWIAAHRSQLMDAGNRLGIRTSQAAGALMVRPVLRRPGGGWRGSLWRWPPR